MKATMQSVHANRAGSLWETQRGEDWRSRAACAGENPELWFSYSEAELQAARTICERCPVRDECLQTAFDNDERHGIFGGLDETERARIVERRRRRRTVHIPGNRGTTERSEVRLKYPREHGSERGYKQHMNLKEPVCEPCRVAARETRREQRRNGGQRVIVGNEKIMEVLKLMQGQHPENVAERLGLTLSGIAKALRRAGMPEQARPFEAARNRQRKKAS